MNDKDQAIENLASHVEDCLNSDAVVVADGNADEIVESMLESGWTWDGKVEHVEGKRIRVLTPPPGVYIGHQLPIEDEEE